MWKKIATRFEISTTKSSLYFLFDKGKTAKVVSFIKHDRFQPFKLLKTRYKLKARSHVEAFVGVKIVFQFRNRCKLPTCASHCWRRFSAGWIRSAWCVYALRTALGKFSPIIFFNNAGVCYCKCFSSFTVHRYRRIK